MTHLYLFTDTSLIPVGTLCRIFGQIHDGRTVVETKEPLTADGLYISEWDGMQANGIPIGIDDTTPGEWITFQPEIPILPDIEKTVSDIKTLSVAKPVELDAAIKRDPAAVVAVSAVSATMVGDKTGWVKLEPMKREDYVKFICERKKVKDEAELLKVHDLVIMKCGDGCDYGDCRGWVIVDPDEKAGE
jgi:hypothetical protein